MNDFPWPCYRSIGKVRTDKHGGGVGLYVNRSYQFRERVDLAVNNDDIIESQFIELTTQSKNVLVGIVYRPPNSKLDQFNECLAELLQKLDLQNKKCYLMGALTKIVPILHVDTYLLSYFFLFFFCIFSPFSRLF